MTAKEELLNIVRGFANDGFSMGYAAKEMGLTRAVVAGLAARNGIKFKCTRYSPKSHQTKGPRKPKPAPELRPAARVSTNPNSRTLPNGKRIVCIWCGCNADPLPGKGMCSEHMSAMRAQGGLVK